MGFHEEILQALFRQIFVESIKESAFRKPNTLRGAAKGMFKSFDRQANLQTDAFRFRLVSGKERMRSDTRQKRKLSTAFESCEFRKNIALQAIFPKFGKFHDTSRIELRNLQTLQILFQTVQFLVSEFLQLFQVARITFAKKLVRKHRNQRRRDAQVERPWNTLFR